jgi:hypothetical protein
MRRLLVVLVVLAALPACHRIYWTKPGFNAADWQRDNYECERDARMSVLSFGTGIAGALNEQGFYNRCLTAHGYYQVTEVSQSAAPQQAHVENNAGQEVRYGSSAQVRCTQACWDQNRGPECYAACDR